MTPGRPVLLIDRSLGLGDLLTALPALRALADAFPEHHRVLLAPRFARPLLSATGVIDAFVEVEDLGLLPGVAGEVDVAVNLHGRGPESHRRLLATDPDRLLGFRHPEVPESADGPEWDDDEHERLRWCRLLEAAGIPADPDALSLPRPTGERSSPARGATLIHPGAKSEARRWPAERFAEVARSEVARGHPVVVTGGPDERRLAAEVVEAAGLPEEASIAGTTDVGGLVLAVAEAARVVCGDTGVAHLATALGTPSVVLFGPMPPQRWGPPLSARHRHRVLWAGRAGDPLGHEPFEGLLDLRVEHVTRQLAALPG